MLVRLVNRLMKTEFKKVLEIIKGADETLMTARAGVEQARSLQPMKRRIGLRNAVVFGRQVSWILQNLKSVVDDFDSWYEPWQDRMKNDPACVYLKNLRNEIEKQGKMQTAVATHVKHLDYGMLMSLVAKTKPPGATSFFVGDPYGGSGWVVPLPTGESEKFYIELPNVPGVELSIEIRFANAPKEIQEMPAVDVCNNYISFLTELIADAKRVFLLSPV